MAETKKSYRDLSPEEREQLDREIAEYHRTQRQTKPTAQTNPTEALASAVLANELLPESVAEIATPEVVSVIGPSGAQSVPGFGSSFATPIAGVPVGPAAAATAGTIAAVKGASDLLKGKKSGRLTRGINAFTTFGQSEIPGLLGFGDHKSTKQRQAEWTNTLLSDGFKPEDIEALRGAAHPEGDTGAEWKSMTPERKAEVMNSVTDMWGTPGILHTAGSDYLNKWSEADRYATTKAAIDNNLLDDSGGDIVVTDEDKLRSLIDDARKNPAYLEEYNKWKQSQPPTAPVDANTSQNMSNTPAGGEGSSSSGSARPSRPGLGQPTFQPVAKVPAPVMPGPEQPSLVTPEDYTNAFLGIYERNSGNKIFNPLSRRF